MFSLDGLCAKILERLQQHPLVGVERPVAPNGVLDDVGHFHAGGIERHQYGLALDLVRQRADVFALEHLRHFEHGIPVCGRGDFRCIVHGPEVGGRDGRCGGECRLCPRVRKGVGDPLRRRIDLG